MKAVTSTVRYAVIHIACGLRIAEVESLSRPLPGDLRCRHCGGPGGKRILDASECGYRRLEVEKRGSVDAKLEV